MKSKEEEALDQLYRCARGNCHYCYLDEKLGCRERQDQAKDVLLNAIKKKDR